MRTPEETANFELLRDVERRVSASLERFGYESPSEPAKIIYAVWWLDADVNNGGFDQYFFNSWGDHYADALRGLQEIGAARTAAILRQALDVFGPAGPSTDRERRQNQIAELSETALDQLEVLDNQFYERPDDLEKLLAEFARSHREELSSTTKS